MQQKMGLMSSMQGQPKPAPRVILRQMDTEAQAIDVSIRMAGFKAGFIAASMGLSDAYVSMLRNGKRRIPKEGPKREAFIAEFCRITGTCLLAQAIRQAEQEADELSQAQINERLAAQLRAA